MKNARIIILLAILGVLGLGAFGMLLPRLDPEGFARMKDANQVRTDLESRKGIPTGADLEGRRMVAREEAIQANRRANLLRKGYTEAEADRQMAAWDK